jgi:hypothetical protein
LHASNSTCSSAGEDDASRGGCETKDTKKLVRCVTGKRYRITQKCWVGMDDAWLDNVGSSAHGSIAADAAAVAFHTQGVYSEVPGRFPHLTDGALRRGGMLSFCWIRANDADAE